jgi:GTP cyclohydrolase II
MERQSAESTLILTVTPPFDQTQTLTPFLALTHPRQSEPCTTRGNSSHISLGVVRLRPSDAIGGRTAVYNEDVSSQDSVRQVASADFPTRWGKFRIYGFEGSFGQGPNRRKEDAVALVMGDVTSTPPLVRIHSQCLTGDVFGSLRCDCRQQLEMALSMIADAGAGVLVYEQQEGRGIGLMAKLQAYELQDAGLDTVEANERLGFKADHREFALPAEILKSLGVRSVRLLSNNPDKVAALEQAGVAVVERVPCEVAPSPHAEDYLKTKKEKLGHLFTSR